ncbi:hypothetical protein TNCV_3573851 [Trichonephila clavipes]|nr:hypothetical protein TNCV_3573851 [Trichonephila clavipes]
MPKKQTCIACATLQMVTAELRYECITLSFLVNEYRIRKFFSRQLRETGSFHLTRHDASRQSTVRSPRLEESILNVVADRPESSTRAVAHHTRLNGDCYFSATDATRTAAGCSSRHLCNCMWFQHDGVPAHFSTDVPTHLTITFGAR